MRPIRLKAPAKINLGLLIGARRPDGYHDLETVFVRVNLYDRITLYPQARGISLKIENADLPGDERNLAYRAARLFLDSAGIRRGVRIELSKRIPVGAGLGGGSSDAAAVLKGMNRLFRPNRAELKTLARQLGSDIPFFLTRTPCRATGRGEILTPVTIPKLAIFLHIPGFQVSTAWAYREMDRLRSRRRRSSVGLTQPAFSLKIALARLKAGDYASLNGLLTNSFEEVVFRLHPELGRIKELMLASGADAALLSGSGSALYAIVHGSRGARVRHALERARVPFLRAETIP